ncbi:hypothetical protein BS78_02G166800 [Paspalum vaginatum]|nr:hypothetical protein BS78_02G166800 [Paspalum vaginatum]
MGISFNGIETFMFGSENNKLRIFPPNSYKFRPNDHIILYEEDLEYIEKRPLYVIFEGKMTGIYISFEEVAAQKRDVKLDGGISWKKYTEIDEAMNQARKILGTNYFMEPAAKEYIQKFRKAKGIKIP